MHHSFIYRERRVDVDLRRRDDGWEWAWDLDGAGFTGNCPTESAQAALHTACTSARTAVDRQLTPTGSARRE